MNLYKTLRGKTNDYEMYVLPDAYSARFEVREGMLQPDRSFIPTHECNGEDPRSSVIIHGFMKWDGCSHLYFGAADNNDGYVHTDAMRGLAEDLQMLILQINEMCFHSIKHADREMFED